MQLLIVESPTKAKTLGRFLPKEYEVEATMGHVKDLPKSTLGVDVEKNFKPEYALVEKRLDAINLIKKKAGKATLVYLATDPDREGEAISMHVKEVVGDAKTKRIVFHEITKEAVEEAIASPRAVDKNLVDAQVARRVLDRLVGYKLSPLLWKKVRRGLSAGRVQSVAVRLIVEKEDEIKKFKAVEYWEIYADLTRKKEKGSFRVSLLKEKGKPVKIGNKSEADKALTQLKKGDYKVSEVKKRLVSKKPYAPFTTSTMTQTAARVFGWSAKRTMSVAQKLYEDGAITYHRTDSTNVSKGAVTKLRKYITDKYGEKYLSSEERVYKTKSKSAQEAHEAVRPTDISKDYSPDEGKFAKDESSLYSLIANRFLASQMAESVYDETVIDVASGDYLLRASGQIMKFDGWRKVIPAKKTGDDTIVELPNVEEGEELKLDKLDSIQKFTEPPARFNEASLIKMLESLGIGRPSTYAPIISTIQVRSYVEKDEGKFTPTPVGVAVTEFLNTNFPEIMDYAFTAEMEDDLDRIADGKVEWEKPIGKFWDPFIKKLGSVEKNAKRVKIETQKLGKKCPKCGDGPKDEQGELVVRIGRFGKFISCSRFPDCDYTEKYLEKIGMKCPDCKVGEVIVKKSKKGKFFGCSKYPECKFASWKNPKKEENSAGHSVEATPKA